MVTQRRALACSQGRRDNSKSRLVRLLGPEQLCPSLALAGPVATTTLSAGLAGSFTLLSCSLLTPQDGPEGPCQQWSWAPPESAAHGADIPAADGSPSPGGSPGFYAGQNSVPEFISGSPDP